MKAYEIPTMNISKFAMENVVTTSSLDKAEAAISGEATANGIVKTSVSDWMPITE